MEANPSGVRKVISTPSLRALSASDVNVRTTPLTCGCQASVAIRTRIRLPAPRSWPSPARRATPRRTSVGPRTGRRELRQRWCGFRRCRADLAVYGLDEAHYRRIAIACLNRVTIPDASFTQPRGRAPASGHAEAGRLTPYGPIVTLLLQRDGRVRLRITAA